MTIEPAKRKIQVTSAFGEGTEQFPSVRYFQVHFEYLENLLTETRLCLDALRLKVEEAGRNGGSADCPRWDKPSPTMSNDTLPRLEAAQTKRLEGT